MNFFLLQSSLVITTMRNDICTTIFCENFIFHTHIVFLFSLFIALIFVPIPPFLSKILVVSQVVI